MQKVHTKVLQSTKIITDFISTVSHIYYYVFFQSSSPLRGTPELSVILLSLLLCQGFDKKI